MDRRGRDTLKLVCLTGAVGTATVHSGSMKSHRAHLSSPAAVTYVATTVELRSIGSSFARARKVNGTIVGVRLPPASEGSVTVSVVRKRGGVHDAHRTTDSSVVGPL